MAKTATSRTKRQVNVRLNSRALRRQTSPSLTGNIDRSLKDLPRPSSPEHVQTELSNHTLAPQSTSRVSKKPKRGKQSRAQRLRADKSKQRAEQTQDVLGEKVKGSKDQSRRIRDRKEVWEVVEEDIKSGVQQDGRTDDGGRAGAVSKSAAERANARPLKEKMEAVDLFETQDALGGLLVSENAETPADGRGKEGNLDIIGTDEQAKNFPVDVFVPTVADISPEKPKSASDPDDDITNGIT
ncbi:MAG: hypothetical protein Q9160_002279 [Pyrenula sp. 1 TL-2023]